MHKQLAHLEIAVKDKMDMRIHQSKRENKNPEPLYMHKRTVHPSYKILVVVKDSVNGITICSEVPTFVDCDSLPFDKWLVQTKVRFRLSEQVSFVLHHRSRASSGCSSQR